MEAQPTAAQLDLAEKITEAARKPVTDLVNAMTLMRWPAGLQAATLQTMADEALRASRRVTVNANGR